MLLEGGVDGRRGGRREEVTSVKGGAKRQVSVTCPQCELRWEVLVVVMSCIYTSV